MTETTDRRRPSKLTIKPGYLWTPTVGASRPRLIVAVHESAYEVEFRTGKPLRRCSYGRFLNWKNQSKAVSEPAS